MSGSGGSRTISRFCPQTPRCLGQSTVGFCRTSGSGAQAFSNQGKTFRAQGYEGFSLNTVHDGSGTLA